MDENHQVNRSKKEKILVHDNGKIFFTRETERKFYFFLTIIMLLSGILAKVGLF